MMIKNQDTPLEEVTIINWSEIHRSLASAQKALAEDAMPTPEEKQAMLKTRARLLARELEENAGPQESLEIIEFRLSGETYGIASSFVREVCPLMDLTLLPGAPPFVLGIINVRGQIISVVDLKVFFNLPPRGLGDLNKVIILSSERIEFGILADPILATHPVLLDEIQPMSLTVTGIGVEYLKGVTAEGVIILDGDKIMGDEKMIVYQEIEEQPISRHYHEEEAI
jgi:purine-binding chemotaxis protein CheW